MSERVKTNSGWNMEKRRERERDKDTGKGKAQERQKERERGLRGKEEKRKKGGRCESRSRESFLQRREGALNCEFK